MPTHSAKDKGAAGMPRAGTRSGGRMPDGRIYDTAVIGGGASGMAAAITAARSGARTVLLEAQPRVGRKLLATGSGRCNISNRDINTGHYRTDCTERLAKILDSFGGGRIEDFFLDIGVPFTSDREGRLYPRGDAAAGVLDMLRFELERTGVEVLTDSRVGAAARSGDLWRIEIKDGGVYRARAVIIACGSPADPGLGGCSDGDCIAESIGVPIIKRRPSLCPLACPSPVLRSLKGIRIKCRAGLNIRGKIIHSEEGELQAGDGVLSGICIFQLSSRLNEEDIGCASVDVDLLPDMPPEDVLSMLRARRARLGELTLENALTGLLNKRVAQAVLRAAGIAPLSRGTDSLTDGELRAIADNIKRMSFEVTGFAGWKQSQSSLGGIPLARMDDGLAVTGKQGLYACGEAINCGGDCGGYNLHWAWCSGITAGESAARYCASADNRKNADKKC